MQETRSAREPRKGDSGWKRKGERAGDWMRIHYPWGIMSPCYMASMETTKVGIALMTFEVAKLV